MESYCIEISYTLVVRLSKSEIETFKLCYTHFIGSSSTNLYSKLVGTDIVINIKRIN